LVETIDTEDIGALRDIASFPSSTNIDDYSHVPPVLTKTWFHTGAYVEGSKISHHLEHEYYREPGLTEAEGLALLLADTILPRTSRLMNSARHVAH
jgi:hypothetical protein